ncbi:MAG: ubiquinol-cytochrome c reductase iron-sulfur subunit [Rickettsia sp.]|nr:ubiquinol-cytochrome c reductase iron-sulfur subunit [Rickettsia sp.]
MFFMKNVENLSQIEKGEITRRDFITLTVTGMASIGTLISFWPLIDSLNPSKDVLSLSSVEVDISSITIGNMLTVKWQGKPVFIKHRTSSEVQNAEDVNINNLIDPEEDFVRVKKKEWLIVIGICTHLGCIPIGNKGDFIGGWFCPCHGSHYDSSGRIRKGPAPLNLEIPPYQFITDTLIKIG